MATRKRFQFPGHNQKLSTRNFLHTWNITFTYFWKRYFCHIIWNLHYMLLVQIFLVCLPPISRAFPPHRWIFLFTRTKKQLNSIKTFPVCHARLPPHIITLTAHIFILWFGCGCWEKPHKTTHIDRQTREQRWKNKPHKVNIFTSDFRKQPTRTHTHG